MRSAGEDARMKVHLSKLRASRLLLSQLVNISDATLIHGKVWPERFTRPSMNSTNNVCSR
jgi:hypothetical protein